MKKLAFFTICIVGFFVLVSHYEELLGRLQWLEAPRLHVIQKGESLSKLAKENYGNVNYWRELALINRAPKPNHLEPGEQVLLPAANVLNDLRRARTLSRVNDIVNTQTAQIGNANTATPSVTTTPPARDLDTNPPAPAAETSPVTSQPFVTEEPVGTAQPLEENGSGVWFWLILGLIALGGVIGFVFYRKRQEEKDKIELEEAAKNSNGGRRNFPNDRRSYAPPRKQENAAV